MKPLALFCWLSLAVFLCSTTCRERREAPVSPSLAPVAAEDWLFSRADSLKDALRFDSATLFYRQAEPLFSQKNNWEKVVACRNGAAWCRWFDHDSESAIAICDSTLPLAIERLGPDHLEIARLYIVLGNIHADRRTGGSMRQALSCYEKARRIYGYHYGARHPAMAEVYDRFAMAHYLADDYTRAILYADSALAMLEAPNSSNGLMWCRLYNNLGLNYESLGRSGRALEYFQKARDIRLNVLHKEDSHVVKFLKNIAHAQLGLGDPYTAQLTYEEALALQMRVGEPGGKLLAFVREGIGDCRMAQGDTVAANAIFLRCLDEFWPSGPPDNRHGRALLLYKIGQCQLARHNPAAALSAFRESAALADARHFEAGNFNRVKPLLGLGDALVQTGQPDQAKQCWQQALVIATNIAGPRHPLVSEIQVRMARLCLQSGRLETALAWTQAAQNACLLPNARVPNGQIPAFNDLSKPAEYLNLLSLDAQIRVRQYDAAPGRPGLLDEAMASYRLAFAFSDTLRTILFTDDARQELQKQLSGIAENALECLSRKQRISPGDALVAEAFSIMEKSKCAMLAADLRESSAGAASGLPAEIQEEELALKAQCAQYRFFLAHTGNAPADPERVVQVQEELFQATHDLDELLERMRREYPAYFQKKYGGPIATLAETRQLVSTNQSTLVAYFWGVRALYAVKVTAVSVQWQCLETSADITPLLNTLRRTLEDGTRAPGNDASQKTAFDQFCQSACQLHSLLLAPFLAPGDTSPLLIVPDGLLGLLPFHILLTGQPSEDDRIGLNYRALPYLIRQRPVQYEFSATTFLANFREPATTGSGYVGFAPDYAEAEPLAMASPQSRTGFAPLRYNKPEVTACAAITGGKALCGQQASKQNFLDLAGNAGVLHLALHAQANREDPQASALVFSAAGDAPSSDCEVPFYELYDMRLKAQLAVLNACNTGVGIVQKGEGVMSLARAFRHAGCPAIVTSLWPVDDETGKEVVVRFFQSLQQGEDKIRALRYASLAFLNETRSDAATHPGYWASLVLIGDSRPLPSRANSFHSMALALGLIGLSIGAAGWAMRRKAGSLF